MVCTRRGSARTIEIQSSVSKRNESQSEPQNDTQNESQNDTQKRDPLAEKIIAAMKANRKRLMVGVDMFF